MKFYIFDKFIYIPLFFICIENSFDLYDMLSLSVYLFSLLVLENGLLLSSFIICFFRDFRPKYDETWESEIISSYVLLWNDLTDFPYLFLALGVFGSSKAL